MPLSPADLARIAKILHVDPDRLAAWLARERRRLAGAGPGRPPRELDAEEVERALAGRSERNAAIELGCSRDTLRAWLRRHPR